MSVLAAATFTDLFFIPAFAASTAMLAQLLAVPTAWFKLRRTDVWAARPRDVRRLDLLVAFTSTPVVLGAVFGGIVGLGVWIGMAVP